MSRIDDAQQHIQGRLVAQALMEFRSEFRDDYPQQVMQDKFGSVGPMQAFLGFMVQHGWISINAAADEIERLRAENAALWERVKRWEPLADPNSVQSGRTNTKDEK